MAFNYFYRVYTHFEDHMLDWHMCQTCNPLEIMLFTIIIIINIARVRSAYNVSGYEMHLQ